MNRIFCLAVIAAFALSYSFAPARADDALNAQLKTNYDAQCTALKDGDFDAFAKLLTSDFTNTDPDGNEQSRSENLAQMKKGMTGVEITTCHVTFVKADRSGSSATASIVASFDGIAHGQPLNVVTRQTDTFAQQGDVWLQSSAVIAEQTITVAGKVYQHAGTPPSPAP